MVTEGVRESVSAKKQERFALCYLVLIIFIIQLLHIRKLGVPVVFDDEFGYLANAAYFAGYDWSGIVSGVPYYSYGYSLLLAPLFLLFEDATNIYQAVVFLNAVLAIGSFLLCYAIAKRISKVEKPLFLLCISFVIAMYPANLVYVNLAMSETLLIFLFWLVLWCMVTIHNTDRIYPFILLGSSLTYMYMVHQRTVGVVIVGMAVIGLLKAKGRISWKQFGMFLLAVIVLFSVHWQIKEYLQSNLWQGSSQTVRNDYASQISKLDIYLSWNGIVDIVRMYIGQVFYIGVTTCLMGYFAIYAMVGKLRRSLKADQADQMDSKDKNWHIDLFLLCSLLATLAIGSIFLSPPHRIDHLLYGRYLEMLIGPFILFGVMRCTNSNTISRKLFLGMLVGFVAMAGLVRLFLGTYDFTKCNPICIVGLIIKPLKENGYDVVTVSVFAILAAIFIYISAAAYHNSQSVLYHKVVPFLISVLFLCGGFLLCGETQAGATIVSWNVKNQKYEELANYIRELEEELPIYYLANESQRDTKYPADAYQFLLKEKKMKWTTRLELNALNEEVLVITGDSNYAEQLGDRYTVCITANDTYLLRTKTSLQEE